VEQGEKLSRVLLRSIGILNSDVNFWRTAFGEILMLAWGELLYCGIFILILGGM
jgi:hypothetical protein